LVSKNRGRFTPEFRAAAVHEVIGNSRSIADVARQHGIVAQTLGNWVTAYREAHVSGPESELTASERAKMKELERQVRELQMENDFLGKSVAFFAKKHR